MKPTEEEIKAEIARLKEMQPKVRKTDMFGGNNHEKIDATLDVLEGEVEDEDEIYARWGDDNDPEVNMDLINCARDALNWMDGEAEELPSKGWESLVQTKGGA